MTCKFCGTQNKSGREYCWKCGKLLPIEQDFYDLMSNIFKIIFNK